MEHRIQEVSNDDVTVNFLYNRHTGSGKVVSLTRRTCSVRGSVNPRV
jgi:hypothetical protein